MPVRQRRPHRRDNRLELGLPERDHIGVALDDNRTVLFRDCRTREMQSVQNLRLVEQLALRAVDVLGRHLRPREGPVVGLGHESAVSRIHDRHARRKQDGERQDGPDRQSLGDEAAGQCEQGDFGGSIKSQTEHDAHRVHLPASRDEPEERTEEGKDHAAGDQLILEPRGIVLTGPHFAKDAHNPD